MNKIFLFLLLFLSSCVASKVMDQDSKQSDAVEKKENEPQKEQSKDVVKPKMNNQRDIESMKNQKLGKSTSIEELKSKQANNSKQKKVNNKPK